MPLPPFFFINGSPAAGKSTLSRALMQRFDKGLHIPLDDIRNWVVSGISDPTDWNEETERQFRIAEEAAADVARRYREAGFAVAFDQCRMPENIAWLTDERVGGPPVYRIILHASLESHLERNALRTTKDFEPEVLVPLIEYLVPQFQPELQNRPEWIHLKNEREGVEESVDALIRLLEIVPAGQDSGR